MNNAAIIAQTMNNAGFDVLPMEMDLSSRSSILSLIDEAQKHGEISMLVNLGEMLLGPLKKGDLSYIFMYVLVPCRMIL